MQTTGDPTPISLYIHVPFCEKKCEYCHFFVLPNRKDLQSIYTEAVFKELEQAYPLFQNKKLISIYFGGGTPSLWGAESIDRFIQAVKRHFLFDPSLEISLEVNPDTVSYQAMREYKASGITRVSMGVQSLDDQLLKVLSRTHSKQKAIDAIYEIKEANLASLSIDLMYDIPYQTEKSWENTLEEVKKLPIEHISLYNLTFEPETVFFKKRKNLQVFLPTPQASVQMFQKAKEVFSDGGWRQYEISAFSKKGHSSKHNLGYWQGRSFLGFGPSAFSFFEKKRFRNILHLKKYAEKIHHQISAVDFEEKLSEDALQKEMMAIHLRVLEGVDIFAFEKSWGELSLELEISLKALQEDGFIKKEGSSLLLTEKGILFYDTVAVEII